MTKKKPTTPPPPKPPPMDPTERVLNLGILSMGLPAARKTRDSIAEEARQEILDALGEHPSSLEILDLFVKYAPALGLRRLGRLLMKVAQGVEQIGSADEEDDDD